MLTITMYKCEECGKVSKSLREILDCEASHLGLTVEEMKEYKLLQEKAKNASFSVWITANDKTRACEEKAIKELIAFEQKHNLTEYKLDEIS